jgi:GntR family transcriptional regulator
LKGFALDAIETSKTHRVYLLLKERIISGSLRPGQRLPSEPHLAVSHQLSRITIRRALDGLSRDGLISRKPGAGTFVREQVPNQAIIGDMTNMLSHLVAMGRTTRVKLLSFGYVMPAPVVSEALKLEPCERTQHSFRVRFLDNIPFSYLSTHVPERIGINYSETDLATTPLLALLERSGVVAVKADQTISATLAGPDVAEALQVEIGSPLISLTRVVLGADGRGVEYLSALYRPDMHQFHMALMRAGEDTNRHWLPTASSKSQTTGRRGTSSRRRKP